ncbi:phospholipase D-like domain-containing protein [Nocardioides sp. GCM10027113]|uniref:phospholipase D-like domain-containing protein n=1 Tax=unclassified Nocardioides TaxID=2615069 RepID=UPI0036093A63
MFVRALALVLATAGLMVPVSAPASATPDNYTPRVGPTFNNPLGSKDQRRAIFRTIMRSINSSPKGSEIDIFSWNFMTSEGKDALLRAQKRGVRVRLLMDDGNTVNVDNPPFRKLRNGLRKGNDGRPKDRRSWARVCEKTCRGGSGSAHTKLFMFSEAGKAKRVLMHGSANFTLASTNNQWNDMYTHTNNRKVYEFGQRIFQEAARDKRAKRPYADEFFKGFRLIMFPLGKKRDPVMQMLRNVRCNGAQNTRSGKTRILVAPDVIRNARGMALGKKLRALYQNGCQVRIGYTVMGIDVGRMLRDPSGPRGAVPMKHLVQDFNGDGQFDNYFHLKAMTIVGHYNGDPRGYAVLNGSANWSGLAKVSDENLGIYRSRKRVLRYEDHLEYWYENFPKNGTPKAGTTTTARRTTLEDQLVFGLGPDAVYEDGTSVTNGEFDPFANVELD